MSESCDPMDCSALGSSVHGISQAKLLEWLSFPSPGDFSDPRIEPESPALQADSLPTELQGKPSETMTRAKMKGRIVTILSSICSCYYYFQNSHIPMVCFLISALFQWSIPAIEAAVFIIVTV